MGEQDQQPEPQAAVAARLAGALGESESKPLEQLTSIVALLGEAVAWELLEEAQRLDAGEGLLTADGLQRRSLGGVFFVLARRRLSRRDRRTVFGVDSQVRRSDDPALLEQRSLESSTRPIPPPPSSSRPVEVQVLRARPRGASVGEAAAPAPSAARPTDAGLPPRPPTVPPPTARSLHLPTALERAFPAEAPEAALQGDAPAPDDAEHAVEAELGVRRRRIIVAPSLLEQEASPAASRGEPARAARARSSRAQRVAPPDVEREGTGGSAEQEVVSLVLPAATESLGEVDLEAEVERLARAFAEDIGELLRQQALEALLRRFGPQ